MTWRRAPRVLVGPVDQPPHAEAGHASPPIIEHIVWLDELYTVG